MVSSNGSMPISSRIWVSQRMAMGVIVKLAISNLEYRISDVRFQCFFFSSRRRHTRLQGDWSSDVCSSDLGRGNEAVSLGTATVVNGVVYSNASNNVSHSYLFAVNAATGSALWNRQVDNQIL